MLPLFIQIDKDMISKQKKDRQIFLKVKVKNKDKQGNFFMSGL